ncbi:MAG: alanine--glyoxylate aminotransferase family protein [Bacteroidales bacterium]|nr:alanine--glyoxylate aminotransferase family protein [Bacteroidales bacterium]
MKARKLLMIPGPIEFEPEVIQAMAIPTTSHVAPDFVESFGHALDMMKEVWLSPSGQPFVVAGSGTLAMDMAAANLVEPGDRVLVISTGYFGERYANLLARYTDQVDVLRASRGEQVSPEQIEAYLKEKDYKLMTFTHVDTSTAVLMDPRPIGELGKKYGVLTVLDGVCSVAGEEMKQDEWGIDVAFTASQKAIGVPPGLALLMASPRAMDVWKNRIKPVANYYADWENWLPIMEAYANRKPAYFGTPAVNLILALETSLRIILEEGMDQRFNRHRKIGRAFRAAMKAAGLDMIPASEDSAANTLSAPFYPEGIAAGDFLAAASAEGVILAGGLLADIKPRYFRVGHMGATTRNDLLATVGAIESALQKNGYDLKPGACLQSAQQAYDAS